MPTTSFYEGKPWAYIRPVSKDFAIYLVDITRARYASKPTCNATQKFCIKSQNPNFRLFPENLQEKRREGKKIVMLHQLPLHAQSFLDSKLLLFFIFYFIFFPSFLGTQTEFIGAVQPPSTEADWIGHLNPWLHCWDFIINPNPSAVHVLFLFWNLICWLDNCLI